MNYAPEVNKLLAILNNPSVTMEHRKECEDRLHTIRFEVTKGQYGIPQDRVDDVMQLEDILNDPTTTEIYKQKAKEAIHKIVNESTAIRSMRKSLIREMRKGRSDNVRDITDYVSKHSKYRND